MNCKNCGAELGEGALFCGNCGMKAETEQPVCEAPAQPVYEAPVQGEYYQESNTQYQEQGSYVPPVMPEYPAETMAPAEKPNTILWIVLAAVEIFTCCQLTGIVSLIFAILGHIASEKGDYAEAAKKVKTAKTWFWVGIALGLLFVIVYAVLMVLGVAAGLSEELFYY